MSVLESGWQSGYSCLETPDRVSILHEQGDVRFYGVMAILATKGGIVSWILLLSHTVLARAANLLHVIMSNVF